MKPLIFSLLLFLTPLALHGEDRYRAVFSEDLETVTVKACFDGAAPRDLYRHEEAGAFTRFIYANDARIEPSSRYDRIRLPGLPENSCVRWQVDLAGAADSNQRISARIEGGFLTNGNLWFWRDNEKRSLSIEVALPDGISISTPWTQQRDVNKLTYSPAPTPAEWSSRIAIGAFPVQRIEVPGAQLLLAAVGKLDQQQREIFANWIAENARSVASVYGRFPYPDTQILIVPIGPRSSAVPFARVVRGGGGAIEFFVDESRSLDDYRGDWTATHELSHLLLPYVSSKDRWLSEGMASYYQNVLRARDGRLTEEQAWQKLESGFERGRASTRGGESLASATQSGWNSTMRVYWSGAAIMLKADARLRALSGGRQSLDTALASLHECCFDTGRNWRAKELFTELDRLTGRRVFSALYDQHVQDGDFPDIGVTYEYLGVETDAQSIELVSGAPGSTVRQDIMSGGQDS
jgi:predicted metalloprotease with PDZ domain